MIEQFKPVILSVTDKNSTSIECYFKYRGIKVLVKQWTDGYREEASSFARSINANHPWQFNLYLLIYKEQAPDNDWLWDTKARVLVDFHGGCTYHVINTQSSLHWDKQTDVDTVYTQIGCDYMHLGDGEHIYDLNCIAYDAKAAVDSLWEAIPDLKIWCHNCGAWFHPREGQDICDKCEVKKADPGIVPDKANNEVEE